MGDQALINVALLDISSTEPFKHVRDYWHPLRHRLAATLLNSDANIEDVVCWGALHEWRGEFTVKTSYNIANVSNSGPEDDRMWKIIWHLG